MIKTIVYDSLAYLTAVVLASWAVYSLTQPSAPQRFQAVLDSCSYESHGISDIAWEVYRKGKAPKGSALYYTRLLRSSNIPAAKCLDAILPDMWGH